MSTSTNDTEEKLAQAQIDALEKLEKQGVTQEAREEYLEDIVQAAVDHRECPACGTIKKDHPTLQCMAKCIRAMRPLGPANDEERKLLDFGTAYLNALDNDTDP